MKLTFRWYGDKDPITLDEIRQIPTMSGIVSAVYDVPPGEVWPRENISDLKKKAHKAGLEFEVVESVPVHEKIKLGKDCERLIENYCENIRRLGEAGVKVVCYNFMPVFDWLRSELEKMLPDGSYALAYDHATVLGMDPGQNELSLPGWDQSYNKEELQDLLAEYENVGEEELWSNLQTFLENVVPVAERAGVKLAIHPDDPPWPMFGLPRIIRDEKTLSRLLEIVDSPFNGLTFCIGSLGVATHNDLPRMIRKFGDRIHFAHLRNVLITGEQCFEESAHPSSCGSLDMFSIVEALVDSGFDGYVRPDHGRMIWGERGRGGYGLYDRALGATYLAGLFEGIHKSKRKGCE